MFLSVGVTLVGMTAGTLDGYRTEGIEDIGDHIISIQISRHLAIYLCFRHLGMSNEVPGAGGQKTKTENTIRRIRIQSISRNLLLYDCLLYTSPSPRD